MINTLLLAVILAASPVAKSMNPKYTPRNAAADKAIQAIIRSYVVEFLRRNPTVNTYLGGGGLDPSLVAVDGRLRDHSARALRDEDRWLSSTMRSIQKIDPRTLSTNARIDREVALAQIRFLLRQHQVRRYQQRALDTYTDELPSIDWRYRACLRPAIGYNPPPWSLVIERVNAIPEIPGVAWISSKGLKSGNTPDYGYPQKRLDTPKRTPNTLRRRYRSSASGSDPERESATRLRDASKQAAAAYRKLHDFIAATFFLDPNSKLVSGVKPAFRKDRFAMGEAEYNWALKNNFRFGKTAAVLFRESWPIVQATRREMIDLAGQIGKKNGWTLPPGEAAVRAVFDQLSKDYPKSDAEMVG